MRPVIASIALHAVLLAPLLAMHVAETPERELVEIEMVALPPAPPPSPAIAGTGAPGMATLQARRAPAAPPPSPFGAIRTEAVERGGHVGFANGLGLGDDDGDPGGVAGGVAGGVVGGVLGMRPPPPPPLPPPPRVSHARAVKLLYPLRDAELDDGHLFVARVTIDEAGDVVGARLIRGFDLPRARDAADAIWRFHYAPALDDVGHAMKITIDQPFGLR